MEIVKRLSAAGATEESLQTLEGLIGASLPADYRQFMAEFNGGRPAPSGFTFATQAGPGDSSVRYFLTLDESDANYSLQRYIGRYGERIPEKTLPIGCDSFGNLILLDVGAKAAGAVCFWDHELESEDEPTWDNVSVVAPSFTAFLNALE